MKSGNRHPQAGFTLLEVVVIITLGAVLSALLIQLTGTGLVGGAKSVNEVKDHFHTVEIMEQITRDYRSWISTDPGPLTDFEARIRTDYVGAVVTGETGMINLRGDDAPNSVLKVTLADGDWKLMTLFTR